MAVYWDNTVRGTNTHLPDITMFPDGFRMVQGNPFATNADYDYVARRAT